MVNKIKINYALEDIQKYLCKEVEITLKGFILDINLINNITNYSSFRGYKTKPFLLNQETELSIETIDVEIEIVEEVDKPDVKYIEGTGLIACEDIKKGQLLSLSDQSCFKKIKRC